MQAHGFPTSTSGAAGLAGLMVTQTALGIAADARVLCILSEGPA
jgi:diaminopropionate ammonia-lyase